MSTATLFINLTESRCGHCGRGAFPQELIHDTLATGYGYGWAHGAPLSGCGATFTAVSSDYCNVSFAIQKLRPDLPWVGPA